MHAVLQPRGTYSTFTYLPQMTDVVGLAGSAAFQCQAWGTADEVIIQHQLQNSMLEMVTWFFSFLIFKKTDQRPRVGHVSPCIN